MTTRQEKFDEDKKRMRSQMGMESESKEIEVEEEVEVETEEEGKMIIIENPEDFDFDCHFETPHKPIQQNKLPGFFMMMAITNGANVMPFFNFLIFILFIYFCITMSIPCTAIITAMLWVCTRAIMFSISSCIRPFYGIE